MYSDPLIGQKLDGRYLIQGIIGKGGMGIVYGGVHEQLGRAVAIKVLMEGVATEPVLVERFLREARIASGLGHGNIVDVSDLGRLPDGRPYLVMPKISGIDFTELLERDGPMSSRRVARLLRGVASALDLVHAKGLLHRDVKPENLMYVRREDGSENVLLMDFGIATLLSPDAARLTAQGMLCGTPAYLSPERARGDDSDQRGDVYSLATVAFELMTGRLPFESENPLRILPMKAMRDPPRLSAVAGHSFPDEVEAVIARGLARDPEQRYFTAGEFLDALDEAVPEFSMPPPDEDPHRSFAPSPSPAPRVATPAMPISIAPMLDEEPPAQVDTAADQGAAPVAASEEQAPVPVDEGAGHAEGHFQDTLSVPQMRKGHPLLWLAVLACGVLAVLWYLRAAPEPAQSADAPVVEPVAVASPEPAAIAPAVPEPTPQPVEEALPVAEPPPSAQRAGKARRPSAPSSRVQPIAVPAASLSSSPVAPEPAPSADALIREAGQELMLGHLAKAADLYQQAVKRDRRNAAAWRGLGIASERLGRRTTAIDALQTALRLEPQGPHASALRDRLQKLEGSR